MTAPLKLREGNTPEVRAHNKGLVEAEIARLSAEYEERVFGPGDFPDEEMRGYRTRVRKLRTALSRYRPNPSHTFTED